MRNPPNEQAVSLAARVHVDRLVNPGLGHGVVVDDLHGQAQPCATGVARSKHVQTDLALSSGWQRDGCRGDAGLRINLRVIHTRHLDQVPHDRPLAAQLSRLCRRISGVAQDQLEMCDIALNHQFHWRP